MDDVIVVWRWLRILSAIAVINFRLLVISQQWRQESLFIITAVIESFKSCLFLYRQHFDLAGNMPKIGIPGMPFAFNVSGLHIYVPNWQRVDNAIVNNKTK